MDKAPEPAQEDSASRTQQSDRVMARVGAGTLVGVDAIPVVVESMMHGDGAALRMLGSVDRVVREAFHRVLNAFVASGLDSPRGMPTVNFSPAGIPKTGTGFDLPLALSLAAAGGSLNNACLVDTAAFGEVNLDGCICPVRGIVPVALAARQQGWRRLIVSADDAPLARAVAGIEVVPVRTLREALFAAASENWAGPEPDSSDGAPWTAGVSRSSAVASSTSRPDTADMREIYGQEHVKRALCVAAAGRHNVLLIGPPGSGKSALVRRLRGLLPPLSESDALDVLRIQSASGMEERPLFSLQDDGSGELLVERPFRSPHHSSSTASLLGGGPEPRPGEVTMAHHGVLFLDELPEFRREALEGMRQPIEEHRITIGRAQRTTTMPADFILIAAMNPCPCGHAGDPRVHCRCSSRAREVYRAKISGPLLDRFDIVVWVAPLPAASYDVATDQEVSSAQLRASVTSAVERGCSRGLGPNGRLEGEQLQDVLREASPLTRQALTRLVERMRLSGRGRARVLRLSRTLADLRDRTTIEAEDILEAGRLRKSWQDA